VTRVGHHRSLLAGFWLLGEHLAQARTISTGRLAFLAVSTGVGWWPLGKGDPKEVGIASVTPSCSPKASKHRPTRLWRRVLFGADLCRRRGFEPQVVQLARC